jgi:hypothetical protein
MEEPTASVDTLNDVTSIVTGHALEEAEAVSS